MIAVVRIMFIFYVTKCRQCVAPGIQECVGTLGTSHSSHSHIQLNVCDFPDEKRRHSRKWIFRQTRIYVNETFSGPHAAFALKYRFT